MYKVIRAFTDLQDGKHVYSIGDEYPRKGYSPSSGRIDELSTAKNMLHNPLIQLNTDFTAVEEVVEQPKRKRGKKNNAQ